MQCLSGFVSSNVRGTVSVEAPPFSARPAEFSPSPAAIFRDHRSSDSASQPAFPPRCLPRQANYALGRTGSVYLAGSEATANIRKNPSKPEIVIDAPGTRVEATHLRRASAGSRLLYWRLPRPKCRHKNSLPLFFCENNRLRRGLNTVEPTGANGDDGSTNRKSVTFARSRASERQPLMRRPLRGKSAISGPQSRVSALSRHRRHPVLPGSIHFFENTMAADMQVRVKNSPRYACGGPRPRLTDEPRRTDVGITNTSINLCVR